MRDLLEKRFFPYVIKPGRYAGGEPGQIVKDPDGRTNYLHAYPDKYELGMSYVGLQTLYHVINSDDRFLCERVFAADRDAEEIMRREDIPLFSLESSRAMSAFDAVGFTLVEETVYTNVLAMLDLGRVPLRSRDRTDRHALIMAGGPAVYNPEPLVPFIDLFFIGDAETGLPEILSVLHETRGQPRAARLEAICRKVESVYVPAFYDNNRRPVVDFAPTAIKARVVSELKPEYYPAKPLLPLIEIVHDHLGVEIMRGCPRGCRFCMAGPIYRPVRPRRKEDIVAQVDTQIRNTGYAATSLLSLSTSDYPGIDSLAVTLARRLEPQRISLTLPSLRPGSVSPDLLDAVSKVRKGGLTIAPEAGTERLRFFVRKSFPDAAIYDTARLAFEKGWTRIKLYFIIGLPSETEEDLLAVGDICRNIHKIGRQYDKKATINVTLSPFIPKPHTPFQWDGFVSEDIIYDRIKLIKRHTRLNQIHFKYHSTKAAMLLCVLGRGDRQLADVIESAYQAGCRFDSWSEEFDFDKWQAAFEKHHIDLGALIRPIPFSQELPWSHIRKGASVEHLKAERGRTSGQLKEFTPRVTTTEGEEGANRRQPAFGRGKKRVASRSSVAPTKNRVRIRWGKTSRCRYMSHLDNLRMMERAIRRARLPVAYSLGYNPTMKLSFGPPLPLGFTSTAEYVDITLETSLVPHMIQNLRAAMPDGTVLYDAKVVIGKSASLSSALNRVVYTLPLRDWKRPDELAMAIEELLSAEALEFERTVKEQSRLVDIRPPIYELHISGDELVMVLGLGDGGYVRPTEVVHFLRKGLVGDVAALQFHRREMYRMQKDGKKTDPMEL